jgi:hypothetical protein
MAIPNRFQSGFRLEDGDAINKALATPQWQTNYGITALAGGARNSSTPVLVLGANTVTTVATAADSVVLPVAVAGSVVWLRNADAADAVQVFANGSDTINGTAGATGISVANSKTVLFVAATNNVWFSLLTA